MKILTVFTGGTIGSTLKDGFIAPEKAQAYTLIDNYRYRGDDGVEFDTVCPYIALSENLNAEKLNLLIKTVADNLKNGYDGIIITHGTDTLQYSAAAVGFAFGAELPIVFVSSNYPLDDKRANGNDNFLAAVELIKSGTKGVFVAYRNGCGDVLYHLGTRLKRHAELSDEVLCIGNICGRYKNGVAELYAFNVDIGSTYVDVKYADKPPILCVSCRPEDSYSYCLDKVKAVLITPYHSGTLNTESDRFKEFCRTLQGKGIPAFVVGVPSAERYESAKSFDELGLVALPPCASVSITVKLWLGLSGGIENIKEFISAPIYGEFAV